MKEKLELYFEKEYQTTVQLLKDDPNWLKGKTKKKEMIWNAVHRCLGAVMFVQELGLAYDDTKAYDEYLEKFKQLIFNL